MNNRNVHVPVSLLLNPEVPASAKVIGMALRLAPGAGPAQLQTLTGLSRPTVLKGLAILEGHKPPRTGPFVKVPALLLATPDVGDQAKVLYGLLQTLPGNRGNSGRFAYVSLSQRSGWSRTTLRRAMTELAVAHWVRLTQENRLAPIHFRLGTPEVRQAAAEADVASRRLQRAEHRGEALMQEYLSLLVDCTDFADNIKPGWLVNPLTNERLELDRFYISKKVAFRVSRRPAPPRDISVRPSDGRFSNGARPDQGRPVPL